MLLCVNLLAQPKFSDKKQDFQDFLSKNTIYPDFSKSNCIQGTVYISFKLDQKGKVNAAKVSRSVFSELDEEALRLIKLSSGKWELPNGFDTTSAVVIPVSFKLSGYNCETKSTAEIQLAIRNYQAEERLISTIANFYKNKDLAKPGQEAQILSLKKQLGIDDEYLQNRIEHGLAKIKQGDTEGACADFLFVKHMGSQLADSYLNQYCK